MAKRNKKVRIRKAPAAPSAAFEATPERLAQAGNDNMSLVKAPIDRAGQRALLTRRFADSYVDRLLKAKRLTYAQWYAADWYREIYQLTGIEARVVARYDITHASASGTNYGMAVTERQAQARMRWRAARETLPSHMLALVDRIVLHDMVPALQGGVQRARFAERLGRALQPLAEWINAPNL
ncbi:hypothetical protein [Rhizorhabdus histidinilytica]|uniref:hypothetical protein n=1 Tax=Rhizorhabdus histidinilytica TaxID=439228 RepID=UPI001ADCAA5F|nr:hypothetical protein [Rhizorhabdus histidinilytica]